MKPFKSIIIGGGPAGLIAAETLAKSGSEVTLYERKASLGRKFLMAGRGGLNLTHSEALEKFEHRYTSAQTFISPLLENFLPSDLVSWCENLGEPTFVGSSGRIFPKSFKASPLLRSWIKRLESLGIIFKMNKTWEGWDQNDDLIFRNQDGSFERTKADATLLALGGGSWPNLGSDGSWIPHLKQKHIPVTPLKPANCGFYVAWSEVFKNKFSGQPLKAISLSFQGEKTPGEIMISNAGIEGGAVYALSSKIRIFLESNSQAIIHLDLRPSMPLAAVINKLSQPQKAQSLSSYLHRTLNLDPLSINLLREADMRIGHYKPDELGNLIKALPISLTAPFPIEKAISSAGGVSLDALDKNLMIKNMPGVFVAGEMLDWEAPTGGYLLQASFATGIGAAIGMINYSTRS